MAPGPLCALEPQAVLLRHPPSNIPHQVASLRRQHNILSVEAETTAAALGAAEAEAAALRAELESVKTQRADMSRATEQSSVQVQARSGQAHASGALCR